MKAGNAKPSLAEARAGSVLLAHDGGPTPTREAIAGVDTLIGTLLACGATSGTVSQLLHETSAGIPAQRA